MALTQKEIIEQLAEEFRLPVTRTHELVKRYFEIMTADLVGKAKRIEIPALGVFAVHVRPKRKTVHPKTGKPIVIPAKKAVRYRSARELRRKLNPSKKPSTP